MHGLNAAEVVATWERAGPLAPLDRALLVLGAAGESEAAALPLALRDKRLLELRAATFGDRMDCVVDCPDCGAAHEFALSVAAVMPALEPVAEQTLSLDGRALPVRPLDSSDVAAAPVDPEEAAAFLTERACPGSAALPQRLASEVVARVAAREEAGEVSLTLYCSDCGAAWSELLDAPAHLWAEVEAAALRLMGEVAEIARAFGWSEAAILGLNSPRRHAYLRLARGG